MEEHRVRAVIAAEALEWFARNRSGALSAEDRTAFGVWLKSSSLHVEEYLRTAVMSQHLHAAMNAVGADAETLIAEARADDSEEVIVPWKPADRLPRARGRARRWRRPKQWALGAAVCLLALAAAIWMERDGQRFGLPKEFETGHGEQRSWLLPDGSGLELNADSAVTVHYNRRERLVEVEGGQALFQVAHEMARRFRVIAGGTAVIAVGTEFDVRRSGGTTVVTVVQGRVAVFASGAPPPPRSRAALPAPSARALSLRAGQQVRIDSLLPHAATPAVVEANVEQTVAWVKHQIAFDREPLAEVADEFSRYSSVPIVIESTRLRELPVSGVLNEYDTDSFLAFIAKLDDVEIRRLDDRILVVDKSE